MLKEHKELSDKIDQRIWKVLNLLQEQDLKHIDTFMLDEAIIAGFDFNADIITVRVEYWDHWESSTYPQWGAVYDFPVSFIDNTVSTQEIIDYWTKVDSDNYKESLEEDFKVVVDNLSKDKTLVEMILTHIKQLS